MNVVLTIENFDEKFESFYGTKKDKCKKINIVPLPSLDCELSITNSQSGNIVLYINKITNEWYTKTNLCDKYRCFWDHHTFTSSPIGIPVEKHTRQKQTLYESECAKLNSPLNSPEFIEVEGVCCSFACAKAYINDQLLKKNPLYVNSSLLLNLMYYEVTKSIDTIKPAPHFKLLSAYGGPFSIEKFREIDSVIIELPCSEHPLMYSNNRYYELLHI